jgi:hypothetical protein
MSSDSIDKRALDAVALKEKFDAELDQLDHRIARLRVLYDQYFMGIEKLEPMYQRKEITKVFNLSQILKLGSTVHRFRYRALLQKFTSYSSYWDRIVRLIEEGRMRRGVAAPAPLGEGPDAPEPVEDDESKPAVAQSLAARRRRFVRERSRVDAQAGGAQAGGAQAGGAQAGGAQVGGSLVGGAQAGGAAAAAQAGGGAAGVAAKGSEPSGGLTPSDFDASDVQSIYRSLVEEKRRAGEAVDKLSRQVVEKSIERILQQVGRTDIRFRILNRDGKVNLTAVVKKTT